MIKKMRYQFILVTMGCISFIFVLILSVINISMTLSSRNQGYALLERIAETPNIIRTRNPEKEEKLPPEKHVGGLDAMRSFSVVYDTQGKVENTIFHENSDLTEEQILQLSEKIIEAPSERGIISKYLYIVKKTDSGAQIFFLDYSMEKNISLRLFHTCFFIGLIGILFIFIVVIFLSRWIVKPVQTAFDKQKQFIADASHELKTPLTIITTNAEVLAAGTPDNKWVNHILAQTKRMSTLIKNLLELTRLDSYTQPMENTVFDMSIAVKNAALSFESLAYESSKKLEIHVVDHISMKGDESSIKQLTTILLDNAFKYSEEKGTVTLHLHQHGEKRVLTVENTGNGIKKAEQERIFERFYCSDTSRSRESGGYGLGLSIASSIVKLHKGNISVKSDESTYTRFVVSF